MRSEEPLKDSGMDNDAVLSIHRGLTIKDLLSVAPRE